MRERELKTTKPRSRLMSRVRQKDTDVEQEVRCLLWSIGARYRINVSDLPGTPDVANKTKRKAIFIHGCFWHHHEGCKRATVPKRNRKFWSDKFDRNKARDRKKEMELEDLSFHVETVWACELKDPEKLRGKLADFWCDRDEDSDKNLPI